MFSAMLRGRVGIVRLLMKKRRMVMMAMETRLTRILSMQSHQLKTKVIKRENAEGDGLMYGGVGP